MKHRYSTWTRATFVALALGSLAAANAHAARLRSADTTVLHATAAAANAEGKVEENVEDNPTAAIACCLNAPGEQGCSDLTADDCTAAGGRNLGPGTTCDVPEGGQDPCGDSQICANEPDGNNNDLRGQLTITARGLAPRAKFSVLVGGVRLGTLRTNALGRGRKRFRGRKLTVDPRGKRIALTDAGGTPVLTAVLSDPTIPCGVACCLATPEEQGCADLTATECAAAGGVDAGTGSCDPDPCPSSPSGAFIDR